MYAWQATVQDEAGNIVPLPVVTVYQENGTTLATIRNQAGTVIANPMTGTIAGFVQFWAAAGTYRIVGSKGGVQTQRWTVDLGVDPDVFQSSKTDTTAGVGMVVGAFGLGETGNVSTLSNIDDETIPSGFWGVGSSTGGTFPAGLSAAAASLRVWRSATGGAWLHQELTYRGDNGSATVRDAVYRRSRSGPGSWTAWSRDAKSSEVSAIAGDIATALTKAQPKMFNISGAAPIATDGRTLYAAKRAIHMVKNNVSGSQLRIVTLGDSWSYLPDIPESIAKWTEKTVSPTTRCFAPATTASNWNWGGMSTTVSGGWTYQDASENIPSWTYGVGVDGHVLYTGSATQTFTVSGLYGSNANIYTGAFGGSWRWRIDGGAWTTVNEGTGGGLTQTVVPLGGATVTLEISTQPNTGSGTVVLYGVRQSSGQRTVINKCGNGSLYSSQMTGYFTHANSRDMFASFSNQLAIINMGTNDYRLSAGTIPNYVANLAAVTSTIRSATPVCGIVVVVPPQSNGSQVRPLSEYRDACYQFCIENGVEMLNLLDVFGGYNAAMWNDNLHLNQSGADMYTAEFNKQFFSLINL